MAKAKSIAGLDIHGPILASACTMIETRLGEMLDFEPYIDDIERVTELHQMRIAAKRLRYSMEIFQPLYVNHTPYGKDFIKVTEQVKALQEHLGEIHDADVLVPRLEQQMARLLKPGHGKGKDGQLRTGVRLVDLEACQGLLTLCAQIRDERTDRYRRLLADWAQYCEQRVFENLVLLLKRAAALPPGLPGMEAAS